MLIIISFSMPIKTIRIWIYALLKYREHIVVIKKWRGPFTWLYDLPGGKIEHGENHIMALKREIVEEVWINESDFVINALLSVEDDFIQHIWEWEEKNEHIIAIVYEVNIISDSIDLNYMEAWWDANGLMLMSIDDKETPKTNILGKVLGEKQESSRKKQ